MSIYLVSVMLTAPLTGLIVADPAAAEPAFDGHAWIGGSFDGSVADVNLVEGDITVPPMLPENDNDFYYVLISIYDSVYSYDQIGFTAVSGNWEATWARLTNCGQDVELGEDYNYHTGFYLTPGLTYHFAMEISSSGNVVYEISRHGAILWTTTQYTGGTHFLREPTTWCNPISSHRGYTVYEEIWTMTDQDPPQWGFDFFNNEADGSTISEWTTFTHKPWPWDPFPSTPNQPEPIAYYGVGANAGDVFIWNEWFRLWSTLIGIDIQQGTTYWYNSNVFILELTPSAEWATDCSSSCPLDLSFSTTAPAGWDVTISPTSGTPELSISLTLDIPAEEPVGNYEIVLRAERASNFYTAWRLQVGIYPQSASGSDGGCVAPGTPITTPGGAVLVEDLVVEDIVIGWDTALGQIEETVVIGQTETLEYYGVDINEGSLVLPAWGQRIYTRTEAGIGWVNNAAEISVGDLLFKPGVQEWVEVSSMVPTDLAEMTCNLMMGDSNDFIANGFLLGGWQS